jgi:hypothetical protein
MSMTIGEAGTETYAILRNPRLAPMSSLAPQGGGGGSTQVNVYVTGNTVRSDADLQRLADTIAAKVEDKMNRRASSLLTVRR